MSELVKHPVHKLLYRKQFFKYLTKGATHMKKLGCFHAHHSNIQYIEEALKGTGIELVHFVDPGLTYRAKDRDFTVEDVQNKIHHTIHWIETSGVDAILITCTFFTAHLCQNDLSSSIPVIKIDTPLFHELCKKEEQQILLFTNPDTVEGTMKELEKFADEHHKKINVTPVLLEGTFELIMRGEEVEYRKQVKEKLALYVQSKENHSLAVAQLSVASITQCVDRTILNPLTPLRRYIEKTLNEDRHKVQGNFSTCYDKSSFLKR